MSNDYLQTKHITSIKKLNFLIKDLREQNKRIVFTTGYFDILHRGHITYLQKAKDIGDILIVGVNEELSVRKLHRTKAINPVQDRIAVLSALASVDYIVSYSEPDATNLVNIIKPDFFVKGSDWKEEDIFEAPAVKKNGGKIKLIPLLKGRSVTATIQKILDLQRSANIVRS
jgi:D-beta-D-heptose 7-phosphate kinase/D-beta-D-heptose 1-phosphate adenosyltransferase